MVSRAKNILSYFPLRYYVAAIVFAFVFLNSLDSIMASQRYIIIQMLDWLAVPAFTSSGNLFVGNSPDAVKIDMPIYVQLLFLIFFPTMALTARTNLVSRAKLLSFGVLCFFAFVAIEFVAIAASVFLDLLSLELVFKMFMIAATIVTGSLVIELTLFRTITIPERTKIKPLFRRRYAKEYAFLILLLILSSGIVYGAVMFLHVDIDSPVLELVHLSLWLNVSTIVTFGYFLANLIYKVRRPAMIRRLGLAAQEDYYKSSAAVIGNALKMPFVSFLIPAYNEERLAGRCIESIDRAAAKYPGTVEIVFINDGSTDGTVKVVSEAIAKLKHASGRLFTIPNSGKGFALVYGMEKTQGEIIFRTDADSIIDEDALTPMMSHFKDPQVGSVCGWVFPIQDKGLWIKVQNVLCANYMYTKRAQEVFDSIITQPGSSTSFRREALLMAGGWKDNIFGEDGEITNRIARYGYKGMFEPRSIVYSEHPHTLIGLLQQRARWGVAFYHSRGRNLRLIRELRTPRSFIFLWNLASHGGGLIRGLIWPYLAALAIVATVNPSYADQSSLGLLLSKLVAIQLSITAIQIALYAYRLGKVHKLGDIKYYPFIRLINIILNVVVKPQVIDVMLYWSSKWKEYSTESFRDLRRVVNRSVDPLYPGGEEEQQSTRYSEKSTLSEEQQQQQSWPKIFSAREIEKNEKKNNIPE